MILRREEPPAGPWRAEPLSALVALLMEGGPIDRPRIVAVDGRGGSGKTSLAERLRAVVPGAAVVHTDDIAWCHSVFGWVDLMIGGVLEPLRRGEAVRFRPPAWEAQERSGFVEVPAGAPLVIIEGVGAGRRELSRLLDASVWVQSDFEEAERRGLIRDGGDEAAVAGWHEWMAEELLFLAFDRPWERATIVVAGTPPADDGGVAGADDDRGVAGAPREDLVMLAPPPPAPHRATRAVAAGRPPAEPGAPVNAPVVFTSTYHAGAEPSYGRSGGPTHAAFEAALGELEGGRCVTFASGMAAVTAILETLPGGARVVLSHSLYWGVRQVLDHRVAAGRLTATAVDVTDTEATLAACEGAALLWLESPTNPLLDVADLRALAHGARERGVLTAVDSTFATPLLQRPLELGADLVMHSVTKYLGGHSDLLMGAAVAADSALVAALEQRREVDGAVPGPMDAFLALRGLRTLDVRLERSQASAHELARRLQAHPAVTRVRYPGLPDDPGHARAQAQMDGFGAMLAFETAGTGEDAERVAERVRLIVHATSLGGVESLLERRARYAGETAMGTPPTLLRLSVGLEHVDDLWADLEQALDGLDRLRG